MKALKVTGILMFTCALGLVGCSGSHVAASSPPSVNAPADANAADSNFSVTQTTVTLKGYEEAVQRTSECMAKSKLELISYGLNPVNNRSMIIEYKSKQVSGDDVFKISRECRAQHLDSTEAAYAAQNLDRMDPKLMEAVQTCVADKGIRLTGKESGAGELLQSVPESRRTDLLNCVYDQARVLFPGLPIEFP